MRPEPAATDLKRVRVVIDGRVQGVFFRDACRHEAEARGVSGWVRNNRDGCVEAVFEGSPEAVDAIVAWCQQGPPRASVTAVTEHPEDPRGEHGFRIR